jgi:hypothetical protein
MQIRRSRAGEPHQVHRRPPSGLRAWPGRCERVNSHLSQILLSGRSCTSRSILEPEVPPEALKALTLRLDMPTIES